jgi:hypothetical protein
MELAGVDGTFSAAFPLQINGARFILTAQIGDSAIFRIPALQEDNGEVLATAKKDNISNRNPVIQLHPFQKGDVVLLLTDGMMDQMAEAENRSIPKQMRECCKEIKRVVSEHPDPARWLPVIFEEGKTKLYEQHRPSVQPKKAMNDMAKLDDETNERQRTAQYEADLKRAEISKDADDCSGVVLLS